MRVNTRYINSTRCSDGVYVRTHRIHFWWSLCTLYLHACQVSHRRRLRSLLLCLCDVLQALINSLVCWFKFTDVQTSANYFHKPLQVCPLLPPFTMLSDWHVYCTPPGGQVPDVCKSYQSQEWNNLGSGVFKLVLPDGKALALFIMQLLFCFKY